MRKHKKVLLILGVGITSLSFSLPLVGLIVSCKDQNKLDKDPIDQIPDNKPNQEKPSKPIEPTTPEDSSKPEKPIGIIYKDSNGIKFSSNGEIIGYEGTSKILNITNQLIDAKTKIKITIKGIADKAFYGLKIQELKFENNSTLEFIGKSAFYGHNLQHISIPKNVKYIGNHAFYIDIDEEIKDQTIDFNKNDKLSEIETFTFYGNSFKEIIFPKNITKVKSSAFEKKSNQDVTIVRGSKKFQQEQNAFLGYSKLYFDIYTDTQTKSDIFETKDRIIFNKGGVILTIRDRKLIENLIIPKELIDKDIQQKVTPIEITEKLFNYSIIKKIEIPKTIRKIGQEVFAKAFYLEEFKINLEGEETSDLEEVGIRAFEQTKLKEINLSKTKIKHLSDELFSQTSLQTIYLPKNEFTIGWRPLEAPFIYITTVWLPQAIINKHSDLDLKNKLFGDVGYRPGTTIILKPYEK